MTPGAKHAANASSCQFFEHLQHSSRLPPCFEGSKFACSTNRSSFSIFWWLTTITACHTEKHCVKNACVCRNDRKVAGGTQSRPLLWVARGVAPTLARGWLRGGSLKENATLFYDSPTNHEAQFGGAYSVRDTRYDQRALGVHMPYGKGGMRTYSYCRAKPGSGASKFAARP